MRANLCIISVFLVGLVALTARADEKLQGIACRSLHLGYPAAEGTAFYNEVTIQKSAVGTYFMVCGWDKGYFGMQELAGGKKLLLFSVWDSKQNDPNGVKDDLRTRLIHKDEKVRVGRFGGEGTGGQSFYDYDWKVGKTYRFLVTCRVEKKRTEYAGWFYVPEKKAWTHLVTFSTVTGSIVTGGRKLRGYYSFVEDFKRDRVSTTKARRAHFGNGWVKTTDGEWNPLDRARFTADANPVTNFDAGLSDGNFFLATGGLTKNRHVKLGDTMRRSAEMSRPLPTDFPGR